MFDIPKNKSRIRETPTLSSNADSRTYTNLKRLRDLSRKRRRRKNGKKKCGGVNKKKDPTKGKTHKFATEMRNIKNFLCATLAT